MTLTDLNAAVQQVIPAAVESYEIRENCVHRTVLTRDGAPRVSETHLPESGGDYSPAALFDQAWLRSSTSPISGRTQGAVRVVDLFAGCGGLSLGIQEAARSLQLDFQAVLANDIEESGLQVYERNFPGVQIEHAPVQELVDGLIGNRPTRRERQLKDEVGDVDILIGGPPCQGHSDLNNQTRRDDPKNELYLSMARFCEVVRPQHVIIENVPGVLHDRKQVAQRTWAHLERLGYRLSTGTINALDFGVAQSRKRNITLASLVIDPCVSDLVTHYGVPHRPLAWAINDLQDVDSESIFDTPPSPRPESIQRMNFLFDRDLFDLPDSERPDCHKLKSHSYVSMYGRMHMDRPAQTITTGFGVMGRGRFVHPTRRRTITPHEAARIQGFPDFFSFSGVSRTQLHTLIGNAVPAKFGYVLGSHLLR